MNKMIIVGVALCLTGCAGAQLQTEWKEKRGYSDADITAIMQQGKEYNRSHISAGFTSNRFTQATEMHSEDRLKSIFCTCYQTIGDKCREKSEGLTPEQKSLWIKANAVDFALVANSTSWEVQRVVDTAECGRSPASK